MSVTSNLNDNTHTITTKQNKEVCLTQQNKMNITPGLSFLNSHNPFTNERISMYLDKLNRMSLNTKDYFVKQISHLSKGVVIVVFSVRAVYVLCALCYHLERHAAAIILNTCAQVQPRGLAFAFGIAVGTLCGLPEHRGRVVDAVCARCYIAV